MRVNNLLKKEQDLQSRLKDSEEASARLKQDWEKYKLDTTKAMEQFIN